MKKLFIIHLLVLTFIGQAYAAAEISRVEYFFDTGPSYGDKDPGYGLATSVPITPDSNLADLEFTADISSLSKGLHKLHVRVMDSDNKWSHDYVSSILKVGISDSSQIIAVEYFFNIDPGYGNGIDVPIIPALNLDDLSFTVDINGLSEGIHVLHVRSKDDNGKWSLNQTGLLTIVSVPDTKISRVEYFIDSDPGFDNGTSVPITVGEDVTASFLADTTGLSEGSHTVFVRSKNDQGRYSPIIITEFTVSADTDNDGIPDDWEIDQYSDIETYDDLSDPDNDGLGMLAEFIHQTDIFDPDTDEDGLLDDVDIQNGLDPLEVDYPPSVITGSITEIFASKATMSSSSVTAGGTSPVTVRGVCYNIYSVPTAADNKTGDGAGTGSFSSFLTELLPETTHYARAYARNAYGIVYGDEVQFTTGIATEVKVNPGIFLLLLEDDEK